MPTLTIKNIPDELYSRLKETAKAHRRSMNSEILYCIERAVCPHKVDISEHLSIAKALRAKTVNHPLTEEQLDTAKNESRP